MEAFRPLSRSQSPRSQRFKDFCLPHLPPVPPRAHVVGACPQRKGRRPPHSTQGCHATRGAWRMEVSRGGNAGHPSRVFTTAAQAASRSRCSVSAVGSIADFTRPPSQPAIEPQKPPHRPPAALRALGQHPDRLQPALPATTTQARPCSSEHVQALRMVSDAAGHATHAPPGHRSTPRAL